MTNGYIAFYSGKRIEIYAESQLAAKEEAIKKLRVPKKGLGLLSVMLAETNATPDKPGTQVVHTPDF